MKEMVPPGPVARRYRLANAVWNTTLFRLVAFGLLLAVILLATLTFQFLPSRYALNEGDVSPFDIKSPAKVTFASQSRTTEERNRAAALVAPVFQAIPDADSQAQRAAAASLTQIGQIRQASAPEAMRVQSLTSLAGVTVSSDTSTAILALSDPEWRDVTTATLHVVDRIMKTRIAPDQVAAAQSTLPTQVDPGLADRQANVVVALARNFIGPTVEIDNVATAQARTEAADQVQPVQVTLEKGETILRDGDVVTADDVEKLEAAGLRNPSIHWQEILGLALLSLVSSLFLCAYIYRIRPALASDARRLVLLGVLVVAPLIAAKLTIPGRELYGYLFPLAAAPMLLAILLDTPTSLVATAVQAAAMAPVLGSASNSGAEMAIATLLAGGLGAVWVNRMERLGTLTTAGIAVAVTNFLIVVAYHLNAGAVDLQQVALYAFLALVSGAMSAALTLGTVYALGNAFGIATTMGLLELAHPSQPLFRRLLAEAPGTYHHSVVVANLAERAAAVIGADTLLCRIGGYYHDIGKLSRPYAFIENQIDGENVHEQLDPFTSARVILAHVPDGIELAIRHGIPGRVQDMIAQHHGTMIVQFFFWQAQQQSSEPVHEEDFRYGGPKPQSREAGLMMLADGIEAAVRANRDHSPENMATIVDKIIQERVAFGQLDDCALTLADLKRVRQTFLSVLQGIYHPRVEYPKEIQATSSLAGTRN